MLTSTALKFITEDTIEQLTLGPSLGQVPSLGQGGGLTEVRLCQGLACEIVDGDWHVTADPPAIVVPVNAPAATIRPAVREDSPDIARYFLVSSDGLADYIWRQIDMPGHSLLEVGAARYAREGVAFSFENCLVVESEGAVVGMLHSFPMVSPSPDEEETDPVLRPYAELEDPGSLYISGLAIEAALRGQGLGTILLQVAEAWALTLDLSRLSLICFERNEAALRLYEREGFRETHRCPLVPHPSLHYQDGDAILMVKYLAEGEV